MSLASGLTLASTVTGGSGTTALVPRIAGSISGVLIPQAGAKFSKDEYNADVMTLKFRAVRTSGWISLIPARNSTLTDFTSMYLWDPQCDVSSESVFADVSLIYKGLMSASLPSAIVTNEKSLQTVTIQNDAGETADFAFYAPQSTYRYMVSGDPEGLPTYNTITNSSNRPIEIVRYYVHSNPDATLPKDSDSDYGNFVGYLSPLVVQYTVSTRSQQLGGYWQCEDVCIKTLVSPFSV